MKISRILYTLRHKIAYLKVEKRLTGRISLKGILHDLDKVFLYMLYSDYNYIQKRHRESNSHHAECKNKEVDYTQMIIDCECARFTKPDKPLNAYDTFVKYYPEHLEKAIPYFKKLGLIGGE